MRTEREIVLASGSPRRRELLGRFAVPFTVDPAKGEEVIPAGLSAGETAASLASQKAAEVSLRHPGALVIGADTVVERDGVILGKPHDETEAAEMLRSLSGRAHHVYSGLCIVCGGEERRIFEETTVHFRPLTEAEITAYICTGEPMDKAGAYGCQGLAALFVERIEGDFFNVMGLPLCALGKLLREWEVELL